MSRQQKRLEREAKIIQAAMGLLEEKSFLDLRMSEVAQASECSMGAVYSHFSSKEDLLLGCAYAVTKDKKLLLHKAFETKLEPLEQLILVSLLVWRTDTLRPENYQLRQLAINPSVWHRASSHRTNKMDELGEELESMIAGVARAALSKRHNGVNDEDVGSLVTGLFGLTLGLYQIKECGFGLLNEGMKEEDGIGLLFCNLGRYLAGWEFDLRDSQARLHELHSLASKIIDEALPD